MSRRFSASVKARQRFAAVEQDRPLPDLPVESPPTGRGWLIVAAVCLIGAVSLATHLVRNPQRPVIAAAQQTEVAE